MTSCTDLFYNYFTTKHCGIEDIIKLFQNNSNKGLDSMTEIKLSLKIKNRLAEELIKKMSPSDILTEETYVSIFGECQGFSPGS